VSTYRRAPLREVALIERDIVDASAIPGGTLYVGLENIESGGRLVNVRPVDAGELLSSKFAFGRSHLLYGKLRPYLAKIARPDFAGICSTDILPVLPGPDLDRGYLAWCLLSPEMIARANSRSSGANLPRLSPNALAEMQIPIPPLPEQRRIAEILDKADALRAKRRAAIAQLETLAESVFLDMFGDPATNPKGWKIAALQDCVAKIQIGPFGSLLHQEDYVCGGIPLVNPKHIQNGVIAAGADESVTPQKFKELDTYHLAPGDVVMGRRGEMGRCAIVEAASCPLLCGTGSLFLRPDNTCTTSVFLRAMLASKAIKSRLERLSLGQTLPNLNSRIVERLQIPLPPVTAQRAFADRITQCKALGGILHSSLSGLHALVDSVQLRALQGAL
jgi:type I restriction enzyme S subunit